MTKQLLAEISEATESIIMSDQDTLHNPYELILAVVIEAYGHDVKATQAQVQLLNTAYVSTLDFTNNKDYDSNGYIKLPTKTTKTVQ